MKLARRDHLVLTLFLCSELLRLNLDSVFNQYCTSHVTVSPNRYFFTEVLN